MSASSAFGSAVVRKVNGEDVQFRRLSMNEYGVLEEVVKQRWRDVERALLNECQVVGTERLEKLRAVESRAVLIHDVLAYLNGKVGTRHALVLSAGESVAANVMASMPFLEANDLVGEIAGLGGVPADPPKAGGTGSPTPPASVNAVPASTLPA